VQVLFPLVDRVVALTSSASTDKIIELAATDGSTGGSTEMLIHHSRDTEYKQWTETQTQTLGAVVKIFCAQRAVLCRVGMCGLVVSV
jgi:hypothetical protein